MLDLSNLDPHDSEYATRAVDHILRTALACQASDVHLDRFQHDLRVRFRVSGKMLDAGRLRDGEKTSLIARLKALAKLVTYRSDTPQEGHFVMRSSVHPICEVRVCTLPLIEGERAVLRLALPSSTTLEIQQLGLPTSILEKLSHSLQRSSGLILITGPAGSGKTTTAYAALRSILSEDSPRCVVTLEDPVEATLPGAAQSQVDGSRGYSWNDGLKAILRQDPQVVFVGEIRDAETAAVVFQAAMTGQLVLTTMHARSVADALRRLIDMQIPAYHLQGCLDILICQRLLSRQCRCQHASPAPPDANCEPCPSCHGSGVDGRLLLAELLPPPEPQLTNALTNGADSRTLQALATAAGMLSLAEQAEQAIQHGQVSRIDANRQIRFEFEL